jgi:hypothetical protein
VKTRRVVRIIAMAAWSAIAVSVVVWATLALWFDGPSSRPLAAWVCSALAAISLRLAMRVRPYYRGLLAAILPSLLVMAWWMSIAPSTSCDWAADVPRTAQAEFRGSLVTISNVRDFEYRLETDYDQRWEARSYDLAAIRGFDLFLSYWGPTQIAHTIVSWDFDDGRHLAISIETRKEKGESYSALRGFYRQYELHYVVADERDLIGLRDERGQIDTSQPFADLRARSNISESAAAATGSAFFSARIRGLPDPRGTSR